MIKRLSFILIALLTLFVSSCRNNENKQAPALKPIAKNVVFITIDTLRRDRVSIYGYPFETSPFLSKLAKDGIVFNNASTAISHTAPSHTTMFTGVYPSIHGVVQNGMHLASDKYSLYKLLSEAGIQNKALTATKFLNGATGFPPDNFWEEKKEHKSSQTADEMLQRAKAWIETINKDKPFFLWIHFFDVHGWEKDEGLPETYIGKIKSSVTEERYEYWTKNQKIDPNLFSSKDELMYQQANYDQRLNYVDAKISEFYTYLNEQGLNQDTLWFITADHGEGLGNHNYMHHDQNLYQEQLRIPLIIHQAGENNLKRKVSNQSIGTVDFFSTLADIFGLKLPSTAILNGKSFIHLLTSDEDANDMRKMFAERRAKDNSTRRRSWLSEKKYALFNQHYKVISSSAEKDEFYNLDEDPFELNNLNENSSEKEDFLAELNKITSSFSGKQDNSKDVTIDPEVMKELKTLGYF